MRGAEVVLTHLLRLLASYGYAPATQRQYGGYLRHFAQWCAARSCTEWPAPADLIATYIRGLEPRHRPRVRALEAVHQASGLGALSEERLIEEALLAQGLKSRSSATPGLRGGAYLNVETRQTYQRRIRAFERWCGARRITPSWSGIDAWLDSAQVSPPARHQYRAALRHWVEIDPPASQKSVGQSHAQSTPTATASQSLPVPAGRSHRALILRTPEQRLLYQLGRTGVAEHHRHAIGFARVSEKRLRVLIRGGYLQMHTGVVRPHDGKGAHTVHYYSLGDRGRRWLKSKAPGRLYRWNPQQLNHDLHLTDIYCQLPPVVQRTWQCESELIEQLRESGQFVAGEAVDAAVVINDEAYAIEIAIGYKRTDIEKKQAFIRDAFGGRGLLVY